MADTSAPTQEQLAEARDRASQLGLGISGRKHFVLIDRVTNEREQCGGFAALMWKIEWREAVANGQPTLKSQTRVSAQRDVRMRASAQRSRIGGATTAGYFQK